jgi:hypothetical protein
MAGEGGGGLMQVQYMYRVVLLHHIRRAETASREKSERKRPTEVRGLGLGLLLGLGLVERTATVQDQGWRNSWHPTLQLW